jgi:nitrogen fixation protein FixH
MAFPTDLPRTAPPRGIVANRWMFVPVLLLMCSVTTITVTVMLAVVGHPLGEEPDYYAKAVAWDTHRAQIATNDRLGWVVTPVLSAGSGGVARLTLDVRHKHGLYIDPETVTVDAIPVRAAELHQELTLERTADGRYAADLPLRVAGQWEFRVTIRKGEDLYTDVFRRTLAFATRQAEATVSGREAGAGW